MLNHGVVRLRVTTSKWGRVWGRFAWVGPIQEKDHHVGMEMVFSCPWNLVLFGNTQETRYNVCHLAILLFLVFSPEFAIPLKVLVVKSGWN